MRSGVVTPAYSACVCIQKTSRTVTWLNTYIFMEMIQIHLQLFVSPLIYNTARSRLVTCSERCCGRMPKNAYNQLSVGDMAFGGLQINVCTCNMMKQIERTGNVSRSCRVSTRSKLEVEKCRSPPPGRSVSHAKIIRKAFRVFFPGNKFRPQRLRQESQY